MHPAGHFATSIAMSAAAYATTRSTELTAGVFAGGFLIDLDHLFDYVAFNGQRDLRPSRFLEYYFKFEFTKVVLPLHAWELMGVLAVVAIFFPHPLLLGYLIGATVHLGLDLIFNQAMVPSIFSFYSFTYRARRGFDKERLILVPVSEPPIVPQGRK